METVRRRPIWFKRWLCWCDTLVGTNILHVETRRIPAAAWCREALTGLRTLVEQTWPLESSEIADLGIKLRIG